MLTATYSLVAIAIEQANVSSFLALTRQAIVTLWSNLHEAEAARIEAALAGLKRFDHYCHQRKVERHVIPAVRGASGEIDRLVGHLDSLSDVGFQLLDNASGQLRLTLERRTTRVRDLCQAMDAYCDCLQQRLRMEEEQLFPIVRCRFSMDDWFALAAKFLGDERDHGSRLRWRDCLERPL